ncbi:hypothetical protein FSP39_025113 [Pinctada imbricata]|uniref:YDG domain-containing protein n=1 Tax=Pinctada imbricata TaxID=66713 RepID=A0AA88XN05_PINIB|nr:hypothetical protein FSP39_025113 [Pinctada imbricata]
MREGEGGWTGREGDREWKEGWRDEREGKAAASEEEVKEEVARWEEDEENRPVRVPKNRPNHYGIVEGVPVGTTWLTRMECCRDGIHRPTVAGIHGGPEGAYSIALSGGYDDNIDLGEGFTYTGEGGRDLKGTANNPKNLRTAPQSKDQLLSRGNLALCRSQETGQPVRVIRGYKLTSPFAPDEGYRYDGLYRVEKCWYCTGVSGFKVWKFALKRLSDQPSPPWTYGESEEEPLDNKETMSEAGSYDSGCHVDDTDSITSSQKSYQSTDSTKTHNDTDDKGNTVSSQESDQGMEDTKTRDEEDKENTESKVSDQGSEDIKTQNDNDGKENTATSQESDEGMNDDTGHCKKDDKENNTSSTECDQAIDDTKPQSQEDDVESTKISKKSDQDVANVETESTSISQQPQIDVEVKTESPVANVEMEGEKNVEGFPVKEKKKNDTTESHVDSKDTQQSTESLD